MGEAAVVTGSGENAVYTCCDDLVVNNQDICVSECEDYCATNPAEWENKCNWIACTACSVCGGDTCAEYGEEALLADDGETLVCCDELVANNQGSCVTTCEPWCEGNASPWEDKCNWGVCQDCDSCFEGEACGAHMEEAVVTGEGDDAVYTCCEGLVVNNQDVCVTECEDYCATNPGEWENKCNWIACTACSACGGYETCAEYGEEALLADDGETLVCCDELVANNQGTCLTTCEPWCAGSATPWEDKCNWLTCADCDSCDGDGDSTSGDGDGDEDDCCGVANGN